MVYQFTGNKQKLWKNIRKYINIQFFRFPKDAERKSKWLHAIRVLTSTVLEDAAKNLICSLHFKKEEIIRHFGLLKIKETAIPTLKMTEEHNENE